MSALVSGRVSAGDEAELRGHLDTCDECSLEVELLRGRSAPLSAGHESEPELAPVPVPLPPQNSDWTVDKIFGASGAPNAPPSADGGAAPAEALARPFTLFSTAEPPAASGGPPAAPAEPPPPKTNPGAPPPAAWDFEPADTSRDATPPEESLLFAEQALNRRIDDSSRKGAAIRAILWGASAVAGVGLLSVSLWMAMAVHQAPPREIAARLKNPGDPSSKTAAPTPDLSRDSEVRDSRSFAPSPVTSAPVPSALPAPVPPAMGAATPAPIKSSLGPKFAVPASSTTMSGTKPYISKPAALLYAKSGDRTPPAAPVKAGSTSVAARETQPAENPAAPAASTPAASTKRDDDDMWPTDDPVHAAPSVPKSTALTKRASGVLSPATPGHAPALAAGVPVDSAPTSAPSPAETATPVAPEAPRVNLKPIDRLRAATEQAAKDQDLLALRQLKATWKNLLRTVVGPDRARAKRDLADCLWEIQTLSGRLADQRETLTAYRDFLLSAPAGGADARSAARLRELEDALSERR